MYAHSGCGIVVKVPTRKRVASARAVSTQADVYTAERTLPHRRHSDLAVNNGDLDPVQA